jgi:hypothetical protein
MGDRAASSWVGILGGGVNDLKTTLRDAIAVESAIVRVEAHQAGDRSTRKAARNRQTDLLRDLTRHPQRLHLGAS